MAEDRFYHITVGVTERPQTTKIGTIERGSGSSIIKERGETIARRGDSIFPNGTKIWAARVYEDGKLVTDAQGNPVQVSVTDTKYSGKIMRLKWGEKGGSVIDVRYIKGYNTLDVLYQERILNFKVDESTEGAADAYFLMFPNGDNDIDETIAPLLVEHLKGHPYNKDSQSKDPEFHTYMFWEKSFEQEAKQETQVLDAKFDAAQIVRLAGTGADATEKCKNLFTIVRSVTDEEPADNKLFAYLLMIADKKPGEFLKAVADYKVKVSNVFVKLQSYDAVDLTTKGTIVATKPEKDRRVIAHDIPAKPKDVYDWLLENFIDPVAYNATFELIKITDKLN